MRKLDMRRCIMEEINAARSQTFGLKSHFWLGLLGVNALI